MLRAAAWTLALVSLVGGAVQAQRGTVGFRGSAAGPSTHSNFSGARHFDNRSGRRGAFSIHHRRYDGYGYGYGYGAYWYPGYFPYDYPDYDGPMDSDRPYSTVAEREPAPPPAQPPAPESPPPKAQVIELPGVANAPPAKPLPPVVFILVNGERLEASRFLLTAASLSINVNRHPRTIPLDQINLDATIAANHERGIDLRVPDDRNEISLSF